MTASPLIRGLIGATLFPLALAAMAREAIAQAPDPDFHIYLAFGQSNMEGAGAVPSAEKTGVNPRFRLMAAVDCPSLNRTKGAWSTAVPPLCRCATGMTPVDYFGRTLVDSLPANIKVGVIVVAVAGTSIKLFDKATYQAYLSDKNTADWLRNIAKEYGSNPYQTLVDLGKAAQKDGVIKGFLLHQGETDGGDPQWPNRVKTVYSDLIADLGLDAAKTPLLAGDLVSASGNVAKLPAALSNSYVIPSTGLPHLTDNLHFSPEGYKEFGKRYASVMLGILKKSGASKVARQGTLNGFALGHVMPGRAGRPSLTFELPQASFVSLMASTLGGEEIGELAGRVFPAGAHTLELAGRPLPAGICFVTMKAGAFTATRPVVLVTR